MLEVLEAGLLTTVQDAGRPGWAHLGVPRGGAADPWSRRVANELLGNEQDDAVLELTLAGVRLQALGPTVVALAGADLGARLDGGRLLLPGRVLTMAPGEGLVFEGGPPGAGARACLALPGGIDVPPVLGSRSTCLVGAFGGVEGRPLRAGDRVRARRTPSAENDAGMADAVWPADPIAPRHREPDGAWRLRVLLAPAELAAGQAVDTVIGRRWTVSSSSDRMGLRLDSTDGPPVEAPALSRLSHGVTAGAIQLPPDGRPVVLGVDHQPTGGYPIVAVVIAADQPALGQLAPGDGVHFVAIGRAEARAALAADRAAFDAARRQLGADARWSALWRSAGA